MHTLADRASVARAAAPAQQSRTPPWSRHCRSHDRPYDNYVVKLKLKPAKEQQETALRRVAEARGWQVVEVYMDAGISGAKLRVAISALV